MEFIRISVCMATYNGSEFIKSQLSSILPQLEKNDEVVISDNNSTDDTLDIIKGFSDKRIKIIIKDSNGGLVKNFENAIKNSRGQYIILSDQDDIWNEDKISIMFNCLQNHDLVLSNCEVVDRTGHTLHSSFFYFRGSEPGFWQNLYRNSYMGCCMGFRREILQYVMPFPKYVYMHDWWIGLMVELKGKVMFYPRPLIKYVRHSKNASPTAGRGYNLFKKMLIRTTILISLVVRIVSLKFKN